MFISVSSVCVAAGRDGLKQKNLKKYGARWKKINENDGCYREGCNPEGRIPDDPNNEDRNKHSNRNSKCNVMCLNFSGYCKSG